MPNTRVPSSKLGKKLQDKKYREFYFAGCVQEELSEQIRKFRKERGFSQEALAKLCGMKQPSISRIEQGFELNWNFKTILKLANGLGLRMRITFDPAEKAIEEFDTQFYP